MRLRGIPIQRYMLVVFVVSTLIVSAFAYSIYQQNKRKDKYTILTILGYEVVRTVRLVNTSMLDMETGHRGYLLTQSREFLKPYNEANTSIEQHIDSLEEIVAGDPEQQQRVQVIREQAHIVKNYLARHIRLVRMGQFSSLNISDMRQLKNAMDKFRTETDIFSNIELDKLSARIRISREEDRKFMKVLMVGICAVIGGLLVMTLLISKVIQRSKETQDELRRARESYSLLLDNLHDGIFDYYPQSGKILLSPIYEDMLGYKPGELGDDVVELKKLVHPDDIPQVDRILEQYIKREVAIYSSIFRMKRKDGRWIWILSRAIGSWDKKGELQRMLGVHTDITEQKKREEDIRELTTDMENFTYIVSHDLRGPLVNIRGFSSEIENSINELSDLLKEQIEKLGKEDRKKAEHLIESDIPESIKFIKYGVERMDGLTSSILDISRIGKRELQNEEIDPNVIVKRCLDSLAYEINEKSINVTIDNLPLITSDAIALEQIMGNIIDNAVKYMDPKRKGVIHIGYKEFPWETQFYVRDNGRGIAESDNRKVFNIFRRASNSGDVRGMGMGMTYVKALVRKMGGRIWFDSIVDKGTTFYFALPYNSIAKKAGSSEVA